MRISRIFFWKFDNIIEIWGIQIWYFDYKIFFTCHYTTSTTKNSGNGTLSREIVKNPQNLVFSSIWPKIAWWGVQIHHKCSFLLAEQGYANERARFGGSLTPKLQSLKTTFFKFSVHPIFQKFILSSKSEKYGANAICRCPWVMNLTKIWPIYGHFNFENFFIEIWYPRDFGPWGHQRGSKN